VDWVSQGAAVIYDYKTSGKSAHPLNAAHVMADDGWDIQASFQERGFDVLAPELAGRRRFRFVMQENEPPYALTVHELSESVMTMGRKRVQYAVDIWARCMATGEWPAYPAAINHPEYPGYAEAQWLNREIKEAAVERQPFNPNVVMAG